MKTPEEGYALGWADAIYAYESKQRKKMSTIDNMPPLPEPTCQYLAYDGYKNPHSYSADQMRAYGEACAAAERERCLEMVGDEDAVVEQVRKKLGKSPT